MGSLRENISYLILMIGVFALQACNGLGYQGGTIPTDFTGISSAIAVSPKTIELNWTAYPGATQYHVYTPSDNNPIATPSFNSLLYQPVQSNPPASSYQYSVTAIDPTTGNEEGVRSDYTSVSLLPHFDFKGTGTITAASETSVVVSWTGYPTVSYLVYVAQQLPTGVVSYNQFTSATVQVSGQSSAIVTGLSEGLEYCAIVVAAYSDQTNDPPDPTLGSFTGEVSSTLSSNAYMVGPNGGFAGSVIANSQKCARTQSPFTTAAASYAVYVQKASLSTQPTFYASIGSSSNPTASVTIYQVNDSTGISTAVGTRNGSGPVTVTTPIPSGAYHFFAVAKDLNSTAQSQIEIGVGVNPVVTPTSPFNRPWVYVRSFNPTENPSAPTGYYPNPQQDGYGTQRAGSSVAVGDFNCDGTKDIAIGIPNASTMAADNRPAESGKVVIYYGVSTGTPATTTTANPPASGAGRRQEITFDITSYAGDSGRNLQLGTSLHVGNFNGDNQQTNQFGGSTKQSSFQCDDLAIGSGYGPMFVLYGTRDITGSGGAVTTYGGLYYSSPTSYTINPSSSCDPSSNVCQVAMYTASSSYQSIVGESMTSGDYNGDGYEDLAVTSETAVATPTSLSYKPAGVWVFRGSPYGLVSPTAYTDTIGAGQDSIATAAGNYDSFPYLPVAPTSTAYAFGFAPPASWGTGSFGSSISSLHNAYYDSDASANHGSQRIRDVLLIGNPSSNLVHACIPKSDYNQLATSYGTIGSTNDVNANFRWDCSKTITAPVGSTTFGTSMVEIKNALQYQPSQFITNSGCTELPSTQYAYGASEAGNSYNEGYGNCTATTPNLGYPGAVAIGAVGQGVFVYYGVNNPKSYTYVGGASNADRVQMGLNRNDYLNNTILGGYVYNGTNYTTTPISVTQGPACAVNSISGFEYCNIQEIVHPTTTQGKYGQVLGAFTGNVNQSTLIPKDHLLAVAAPYRNFSLSSGATYTNVGSVQLYLQDSESNPIVIPPAAAVPPDACNTATGGSCRYSDGFSNTLTQSMDYDESTLTNNLNFGLGGIAGGPVMAGTINTYSTNSDIVIGVPGYASPAVASGTPPSVVDNGAGMVFFSHTGTYRNYEVSNPDTPQTKSLWHELNQSFSQESNMKFHQAISIGDINQDGIGDAEVRINEGSQNFIRIYNGSATQVGFNSTSYSQFQVQGDGSAGIRFVPIGNITGSSFPSFLVTGSTASYILFDAIGGISTGFPTPLGAAGAPRKLSAPSLPSTTYLDFSDTALYNAENPSNLTSTLLAYTNFAHGDFNGDGYEDFAIGFNGSQSILNSSNTAVATGGVGRVMVFYGGASNGFQTQPDTNGGYPLTSAYFTDYSADAAPNYSATDSSVPCLNGTNCKIQMLHESATTSFGSSMTAVPAGNCVDNNGVSHAVSSLVVSAVKAGVVSLYTYRPRCLDSPSTAAGLSGLVAYTDLASNNTGLAPASSTLELPTGSSSTLGLTMTSIKKLMGTSATNNTIESHFVVTDQGSNRVLIYPLLAFNYNGLSNQYPANTNFEQPATSALSAFENAGSNFIKDGGRLVDYSASAMLNGTTGTVAGFGNGLAALGDVNGDQYNDIGVGISSINLTSLNTTTNTYTQIPEKGSILVIFGGATGPQTHNPSPNYNNPIEPAQVSSCYVSPNNGQPLSVCNPALLYAPEPTNALRNGAYELSFLSPYAAVSTSSATVQGPNNGLGTFLFGVPGRDSILQSTQSQNLQILQGGAFYVLP